MKIDVDWIQQQIEDCSPPLDKCHFNSEYNSRIIIKTLQKVLEYHSEADCKGKNLTQLFESYLDADNPVTKSVYKQSLLNRLRRIDDQTTLG